MTPLVVLALSAFTSIAFGSVPEPKKALVARAQPDFINQSISVNVDNLTISPLRLSTLRK